MPCSRSTKYAGNKDWFGDWEKKARIEKLKVSKPIELTGEEYEGKYELNNKSAQSYIIDELRGDYTNSDTGDKIRISRKGAEKVTRHDAENHLHLKSIVAIPQMIEQATFITEEANEKQKNRFVSCRYYVVGLNIGGIDYTAKLVVGVANNGETYYDHALTEIEKGRLLESIDPIKREFANKEVSLSEYKDKRLVSILQNDSSRVVDENGEPLVVYHGTNVEFTEFRMSPDGALGKGAYFASSEEVARGYGRGGRTIPAFLSLRSPLIASGPLSPKEKEEVSHGKYDGVFATGLGFYVAFEPIQIKSATDNVGSFDVENPDIRFRIGERRKADMKAGLLNKLTNATDEQVERTINEIEKLGESSKEGGNPKLEKVAFHWAKKGTIILPEDNDKIIQAVRLAENAKVDPMKYDRPMEIINKYNTDVEYGNPINPDDIPAFTNKREIGKSGVFVYDVEESDAGQKAVCKVAHAQFGYSRKDEMSRQPWCLASFTRTGEPTQSAKGFWFNTCNSVGKKIAIPDGLHKFEGGDVRRLYQLGDYSFHGEDISDEINDEELEGVSEIEEIQSDNILAKDVSLEEAIELLNRIDIEVADGTNVAFDSSTNDIRFRLQEENDKFNKELERYAKGELGSNEYISIGKPFGVLALFMPDDQIILRQKVLSKSLKKHGLNISSIRDLPKAISKPVFIFRSKRGSLSILTELTSPEGKSIFVAIGLGAKKQLGHEFLEVNDVLTIHGREEENVILPIIENNSLIWVDKEKGQRWLSSAKSNSQAIANDALSSATKIIKEFENPISMDIRLRANREETAYDMAFGRSVKESMAKQVAKKFSVPMSTKVVSRLDLPEEQQKKSVIYDNGTLSIVAENIKDGSIELATLNEVLPKQGLSALVDSNVQEDILTVLGKASGAFMGNASQESVRSYISDLHTQSVSPDMIGAMADVMRGMLDAAGFNSKLSDPNAAYMLYKAIRGDKNGSTAAEDIVSKMQEANVRKVLSDYDEVFNKMTDEQIMDELNLEHNEDLRTRIENAQRRINAVNAMFRYESDNTGRSMAETMHQIYSKRGIEWRRKWVDETVVFDQYQKEIEKLTGKKVPDFANLHEIYNQSSSIATATIDRLEKHYYKPAIEQARKVKELLGFNDRQLHDYMIAKHAPERNAKMRQDIMEEKGISYEETGVEGSIEEEAGDEDPSGDIIIGDKVSYIDQDGNIQEGVVQSQNGAEYIGVSDEQGNITPVHVDNVRPIEEIAQEESPQGLQDVYGNEAQEEAQPQKTAVPVSVDTHSEQDVVDDILSQSQGDIEIAIEAAKFELDQSKKEVKKLSKEVPPEAKTSREAFIKHKLQQKAVIEEANERLQKMQRVIDLLEQRWEDGSNNTTKGLSQEVAELDTPNIVQEIQENETKSIQENLSEQDTAKTPSGESQNEVIPEDQINKSSTHVISEDNGRQDDGIYDPALESDGNSELTEQLSREKTTAQQLQEIPEVQEGKQQIPDVQRNSSSPKGGEQAIANKQRDAINVESQSEVEVASNDNTTSDSSFTDGGAAEERGAKSSTEVDVITNQISKEKEKRQKRYTKLIDQLNKNGLAVEVIDSQEAYDEKLQEVSEANGSLFKDLKGRVYGFTANGKVYIDPSKMDLNTPIHEFTHLWYTAMKSKDPELVKKGMGLVKRTKYYREVKNNSAYKGLTEELLLDEALAHALGEIGSKKIEKKGVARTKFGLWVKEFFDKLKELFGEKSDMDMYDFADMVLSDLLSGKSISSSKESGTRFRLSEEQEQIKQKAQANGSFMEAPNGEPSKLNEHQWTQVRTTAFKDWFGD